MGLLWDAGGYPQPEEPAALRHARRGGVRLSCAGVGESDPVAAAFLYEGMRAVGSDPGMDELPPLVLQVRREVNLAAMATLEEANVSTLQQTEPATVEPGRGGPFIVVTGHDLRPSSFWSRPRPRRERVHHMDAPRNVIPELRKYPRI